MSRDGWPEGICAACVCAVAAVHSCRAVAAVLGLPGFRCMHASCILPMLTCICAGCPLSVCGRFGFGMDDLKGQLLESIGADGGMQAQFATISDMLKKVLVYACVCVGGARWGISGQSLRPLWLRLWTLLQTLLMSCVAGVQPLCCGVTLPPSPVPSRPCLQWEFSEEQLGQVMHTFTVKLRHKYGAALEVCGEAAFGGTPSMRTM